MELKKQIEKEIVECYKNELEKRRRPEQVQKIIEKVWTKKHLIEKLAINLIKKDLHLLVADYISCQFFALNYMPYLPKIEHITSDKGFERWEKYKSWFKKKVSQENTKKTVTKLHKKIKDKKVLLSLKEIDKYEEEDKKLFFNTLRGFNLCLTSTTLYNPKSCFCKECYFKFFCIKVLKTRNIYLFYYRFNKINKNSFIKKIKEKQLSFLG